MGMVIAYEWIDRCCRVRTEKQVVDEGMERMVEKEKKLRMVQDERFERISLYSRCLIDERWGL
jgi:hypothetical protein